MSLLDILTVLVQADVEAVKAVCATIVFLASVALCGLIGISLLVILLCFAVIIGGSDE